MNEVEVKILEIDIVQIKRKLINLGATKVFEDSMTWTSFDFPDKRLSKDEQLLRLRKEGKETTLTHKKLTSKTQAKISEETILKVNDYNTTKLLLKNLGLLEKKGFPLTKHRISYQLDEVHFDIDTLPGIPTFLEIEGPDIETIYAYGNKLGFKTTELKPWGTRELFRHYKNS